MMENFLHLGPKNFQSLIIDGRNEFAYNTVRALGTIKSFIFRGLTGLVVCVPTFSAVDPGSIHRSDRLFRAIRPGSPHPVCHELDKRCVG